MSDIKTKFINDPEQITPELLEGYVLAYPDQVKLGGENIVVRANPKSEDKVAIVTLGGSGHEPALSGFVGEGMLDCSVVGDIFAAPGAQRLFQALRYPVGCPEPLRRRDECEHGLPVGRTCRHQGETSADSRRYQCRYRCRHQRPSRLGRLCAFV